MADSGLIAQIADCRIELKQGSITEQTTAAIVNSVCGGKKMKGGASNKAVRNAAGSSIEKEYAENNPDGKLEIVMTNGGDLTQEKIFHVIARKDVTALGYVVEKTLQMAETEELTSIAFPALGTGKRGGNAKKLAVPMLEAMRDFALEERPTILRTIKLVIYDADMFTVYKETMLETLGRYCMVE